MNGCTNVCNNVKFLVDILCKLRNISFGVVSDDFKLRLVKTLSKTLSDCDLGIFSDKNFENSPNMDNISSIIEFLSKMATCLYDSSAIRKDGIFFTPLNLSQEMASIALNYLGFNDLKRISILEPSVGFGNLLVGFFLELRKRVPDEGEFSFLIRNLLQNTTVVDIYQYNLILTELVLKTLFVCDDDWEHINLKKIHGDFLTLGINQNFDFIFMNPPYERLKVDIKEFKNLGKREIVSLKKEVELYKERLYKSKNYRYSMKGVVDKYKLFIEKSLNLLSAKGKLLAIVPSQMWGDNVSRNLRTWILRKFDLLEIHFLSESDHRFQIGSRKVSQSFSYFLLKKKENNIDNQIRIRLPDNTVNTFKQIQILSLSDFSVIPKASSEELKILKVLRKEFPSIGDLKFVLNSRGEIDVTKFKEFLNEKSALDKDKDKDYLPLIRGRHIGLFTLKDVKEVISWKHINTFLSKRKINHVYSKRIVGQQVSNQNLRKRLKFVMVENAFVANSCNYLLVDDVFLKPEILLAVLNSELIEWYFRKYSYTNHVANYEIDGFPIAVSNLKEFEEEILEYVSILSKEFDREVYVKLNSIIYDAYLIGEGERRLIKGVL
jgi:Alw26I/Eco31I/Esp3I family type II restriction m6 adenine DNA methyltransferase